MELEAPPAPMSPEEILPLVVWDLIFEKLKESDVKNCYQTCRAFEDILKPQRTTFLLPEVLPILYCYLKRGDEESENDLQGENRVEGENHRRGEGENDENHAERAVTFQISDSFYNQKLPTSLIKMRLVSQFWKRTVDSYLQNHPELDDIGFLQNLSETYKNDHFVHFPNIFDNGKKLAKLNSFVGKAFHRDSNPFITRHVSYFELNLFLPEDEGLMGLNRLRTSFGDMLESFGSHIWTCHLNFTRNDTDPEDYHYFLHSFLHLMPNLRCLEVHKSCVRRYGDEENNTLKELVRTNPFPKFEHLIKLSLGAIPEPIALGILSQNGHLHKLQLCTTHLPDSIVENTLVTNLEQLALTGPKQRELAQLQNLDLPLKALCLESVFANLSTVFQAVSTPHRNALEHLVLNLKSEPEDNVEISNLRLELPNLKKIWISLDFIPQTIDFLVTCTALQDVMLSIELPNWYDHFSTAENDPIAPVIQFLNCYTRMHESNIWEVLPILESIRLKLKVHSTAVYAVRLTKFTRRDHEIYLSELDEDYE